jgi:hypothetical protein
MSGTPDDLKTGFEDLIAFLRQANDKALAGEVCDLGSLEKNISALCAEAEKAKGADAAALGPLMSEMISRLDELEFNLRALKNHQTG